MARITRRVRGSLQEEFTINFGENKSPTEMNLRGFCSVTHVLLALP